MSPGGLRAEREQVAAAARQLADAGLTIGTAGNASMRRGACILITATGTDLGQVSAEQIVACDLRGRPLAGEDPGLAPSSELRIHLGAYRRSQVGAIVHTHPPIATALSTVLDELVLAGPDARILGEVVPVVADAPPASAPLAELVLEALEGRPAVLMAHHGSVTAGPDLDAAARTAGRLEAAAERVWRAAQAAPPPGADPASAAPRRPVIIPPAGLRILDVWTPSKHVRGALAAGLGRRLGAGHRSGLGAIVHAEGLSAARVAGGTEGELPLVHYAMRDFGGPVRIAVSVSGDPAELVERALAALDGRTAALLAGHGMLVVGRDVEAALERARLLEWTCTVYQRATSIAPPRVLDPGQLTAVAEPAGAL